MPEILLFRFISADLVEWLQDEATLEQGSLADLAKQIDGRRLLLVAPGETVMLTQVAVPGRNRVARLRAIPYALEDSLAAEVEELHFATGEAKAGMSIPVAVISHEILKSWLDTCTEAGITLAAVAPEPLLLPYEEGSWSLLLADDRAVVRCGAWDGFANEQEHLELLLAAALAEAGEQAPQYLQVWGEVTPELAGLGIEIHQQSLYGEPLKVFAAGYQDATTLNLLQSSYGHQANFAKWLRPWRGAAILAGLWLALQISLQISEYWQLKHEQASLQTEMERVYRDAVPNARRIVNPQVQLENHLRELRRGESGMQAIFLELLYQAGHPLAAVNGVTLRGLRYKNDQLDLDLESDSLEVLDQLKERFGELPELNAQMRTTKREGKVESQIALKKASS